MLVLILSIIQSNMNNFLAVILKPIQFSDDIMNIAKPKDNLQENFRLLMFSLHELEYKYVESEYF